MPRPSAAGVAFNAMILPLAPLRLSGVLWYHGESDTKRPADYGRILPALIQGWRAAWSSELPFVIVQLPGYGARTELPGESAWAELRESQRRVILAVPKTALVTTIDIADATIHPRNKTDVGKRLALAAERLVYGQPVVASGPVLDAATRRSNGRVVLRFCEVGGGLAAQGGERLRGFAVSADGRIFEAAEARITAPTTAEIWRNAVPEPIAVRYAWTDNPICNLVNRESLPASPPCHRRSSTATGAP